MSNKGYWLNTKIVRYPNIEKPCVKLSYCPYGQLIEEFPHDGENQTKLACLEQNGAIINFGHNCPVHYHAELVGDK